MDVMEKLVELLDDIQVRGEDFTDYEIYGMRVPDTISNEDVALHLIAHGVTVQECGEWVYDHWCEFKCSVCGEFSSSKPYKGKENYCSNCGAKMIPQTPKGD